MTMSPAPQMMRMHCPHLKQRPLLQLLLLPLLLLLLLLVLLLLLLMLLVLVLLLLLLPLRRIGPCPHPLPAWRG